MSKRQRHLASAMTKLIAQRHEPMDGAYIDIHVNGDKGSMCVDGWVNNLTEDETRALTEVWEETRE